MVDENNALGGIIGLTWCSLNLALAVCCSICYSTLGWRGGCEIFVAMCCRGPAVGKAVTIGRHWQISGISCVQTIRPSPALCLRSGARGVESAEPSCGGSGPRDMRRVGRRERRLSRRGLYVRGLQYSRHLCRQAPGAGLSTQELDHARDPSVGVGAICFTMRQSAARTPGPWKLRRRQSESEDPIRCARVPLH